MIFLTDIATFASLFGFLYTANIDYLIASGIFCIAYALIDKLDDSKRELDK